MGSRCHCQSLPVLKMSVCLGLSLCFQFKLALFLCDKELPFLRHKKMLFPRVFPRHKELQFLRHKLLLFLSNRVRTTISESVPPKEHVDSADELLEQVEVIVCCSIPRKPSGLLLAITKDIVCSGQCLSLDDES